MSKAVVLVHHGRSIDNRVVYRAVLHRKNRLTGNTVSRLLRPYRLSRTTAMRDAVRLARRTHARLAVS
jgi:hypothetical protein